MALMKFKRTSRMKGMMQLQTLTGPLEGWVTEQCSACSIHGNSVQHSIVLLSWWGAERNWNILLLEALQKRICFLFNNLRVQAGQSQVSGGCAADIFLRYLKRSPWSPRDAQLVIWNLMELKALIGPGRL